MSDAIRWVIGEMSAKSLRGSNMQDVIFAGTETRKKVNFAEVSLVLDNTDHVFDIDFEEIMVTRRLFRSGESVYQINRANCRLKDIHELFMDTGLGRDGYSIIGQGNVSQIVSTKAEDRRSLFEEAAGVSKYKYRKEEAIRKLTSVEENLVRINDITIELESQLSPLKRQSKKARKYLELYTEYKGLDVSLSLVTIDKNKLAAEKADALYAEVEEELNDMRAKASDTERRISLLHDENSEKDKEKDGKNAELRENEAGISKINASISIAENDIKNNNLNLKRIDSEIEAINRKNSERKNRIEEYNRSVEEKNNEAQTILKRFDRMKADSSDTTANQENLRTAIEAAKSESAELLNEVSSQREKISGIENLRSSFLERREAVEAEVKSFKAGIENTEKEIKDAEEQIAAKREKHEKIKASVERQRERSDKLNEELRGIAARFNDLNVEYNSKTSKKRILEGMENDYSGYARSVKTVLKADELKRLAIYGTVSGLIDVKREYVTAIEIALGGALQHIIVESEEDAKTAIAYLRRTNAGRATFLPISSVHGRVLDNANAVGKSRGYIGIACDLISYDKKYDGIMKSLLGRVVVADNIDNAIAMSRAFGYKFRVVTLDGDVLNSGGSMSGGSVNKQSGFLSRATEIKTLSKEITALSGELRDIKSKREALENDLRMVSNQLSSYVPLMREYEDEMLRLENTAEHLRQSLVNGGSTEQNYTNELAQIEGQLSESSEEIALLLQSVRSKQNEAEKKQAEIEKLEEEYPLITQEKEEQSKSLMDETLNLASLENEIRTLNSKISETRADIENSAQEILNKKEEQERINKENDAFYGQIRSGEESVSEKKKLSEAIRKQIEFIDEQRAKNTEMLQSIQTSNKDLTDRMLQLQQELSRVESRRDKLNTERENTLNRLWEEYELSYNAALEIRAELEDEKASFARLAELKAAIKALGSINMDAIEEYKSVKERFEFLTAQKEDLEKSKENLNKIISSMEELMEKHFTENFSEINKSFSQVFRELFGGGNGRLYLSAPDNILESGVEIEVQLPGKGLQNINLYSGGEKSFIAIALLFAILKVKPTPFCILDEIDAALDDVNVSRFATYLKNYIDRTQFIVITHRRGTMEAATILYGVTMQEKGVSKLLSLNIDEVDDNLVK
ncbi:MAG: chromosome segregation protein SMC [Oscillospiraceae bacterium]|nr:chromosome segregation protein SMC [Oscillospiraceae bacterium]